MLDASATGADIYKLTLVDVIVTCQADSGFGGVAVVTIAHQVPPWCGFLRLVRETYCFLQRPEMRRWRGILKNSPWGFSARHVDAVKP